MHRCTIRQSSLTEEEKRAPIESNDFRSSKRHHHSPARMSSAPLSFTATATTDAHNKTKTRLTGAQWSFPLAFLHPAASDARKEHTRTPQQLSRRCRRRRGRCPFSAPEFEANATLMIGFFLRSQPILATETGPWAAEQGGCLHPGLLLRIPEAVPGIWPPPLPSGLEDPDPRLLSISPVID